MRITFSTVDLISFNLVWFGLVLMGDHFIPFALTWLCLHLYYCEDKKLELRFILTVSLLGILLDSLLMLSGVFVFEHGRHIPYWLMMLWICFSANVATMIKEFSPPLSVTAAFGAVLAPLSYVAGSNLGSVDFGYSVLFTFCVLSFLWGPAVVCMSLFYDYLKPVETCHV